jgi:hypothetical protein
MLPVKSFRGDAAHELRAGTEVVTATSTESSHEDTKQIFKLRFDALVVWSGGRVWGKWAHMGFPNALLEVAFVGSKLPQRSTLGKKIWRKRQPLVPHT